MNQFIRQSVGIDVAQKELVVSIAQQNQDGSLVIRGPKTFTNTTNGFCMLMRWVNKTADEKLSLLYAMEATGAYHEKLAHWLDDQNKHVAVVLPSKISHYIKTLDCKTITDKSCSDAIARFAVERKLDVWKKPNKVYRSLRHATRERLQLIEERTMIKNQIHAEKLEVDCSQEAISRMRVRIRMINGQIKDVEKSIDLMIDTNAQIKKQSEYLCSITGIGTKTFASVVGETNGFELIRNKKQLSSYAGLDVKQKQSGTSIRGKSMISKRGNKYLRKAMYFPAFTAIKHDEKMKILYQRLVSKHGIKMKAAVAVQRKLLELMYVLWKNEVKYDTEYSNEKIRAVIN